MTEPTPLHDEVLEKYPGLFDREDEWVALVADPEHELVPVPEPSFSELLDQLKGGLPEEVVLATQLRVNAEARYRADIETEEDSDGGDDEGGPAEVAAGSDPAGAAVVARDDGEGDVGEEGGGEAALGRDPGPGPGAARED